MTRLRVTEASLRYDVPVPATVDYLARLIAHQKTDVLACTEAGRARVARRLRKRLGKHWRVAKAGEFLLAWDNRVLVSDKPGFKIRLLSRILWSGPKGGRRAFRHAVKRLRVDGRKVFLRPFHAPASVQAGDSWKGNKRARASRDGFAELARQIRASHHAFPDAVTITPGDSNVDQRRTCWRGFISRHLGTSVWFRRVPRRGTHGQRLIDGINVYGRCRVIDAWVASGVRRPRGMDHVPITSVIEL